MRAFLILGISLILFGCGQESVEVYGIKIGGLESEIPNIESYKGGVDKKGRITYRERNFETDFDKIIEIVIEDGRVSSVVKNGFKKYQDYGEFRFKIAKMIERWGKPDSIGEDQFEDGSIVTRVIFKPRNNIIKMISVSYFGGYLIEIYDTIDE